MRKIPTLFKRDPDNLRHVLPEVTPGCEWVLAGEGIATRKFDGTCCYYDGEAWFARREVKPGKPAPDGFVSVDHDETTGKTVGWVPMADSPFERWFIEAIVRRKRANPGTYELVGPKINGNPENMRDHILLEHATVQPFRDAHISTFEDARAFVIELGRHGIEGIVWHHPDGRMAKLKGRDFA